MRISLTDILSRFKRIPGPEGPKDGPESVQERDLQPRQGGNEPQEDAELAALSQELESLGTLAVPAAAKERTWATVREEVRSGGAQMPTTRRARKHRNTRIRRRRPTEAATPDSCVPVLAGPAGGGHLRSTAPHFLPYGGPSAFFGRRGDRQSAQGLQLLTQGGEFRVLLRLIPPLFGLQIPFLHGLRTILGTLRPRDPLEPA